MLETDVFDADLAQLRWLADRMVEPRAGFRRRAVRVRVWQGSPGSSGCSCGRRRKAMGELEAERRVAAEAADVGLGDREWRLKIVEGGQAGAVSAVS